MMKTIPHSKPFVGTTEARAAARVISSGQLSQGPQVSLLEKELSTYVGHHYGVAVSSGTAALFCALRALGVGTGDEVVVPTYVCTALLNAVCFCGATPVLADVDPCTGNMGPENVRAVLGRKVKAVVVAHMFGCPAPAAEIERLGIAVIEDCAQCVGATAGGRRVGGMTSASIFSFYSTKVLGAGEGGMVATSDRTIAQRVRDMREYDNRDSYSVRFNLKLSDIHAAVAREQLKKIAAIVRLRRSIAEVYDKAFAPLLGEEALPPRPAGSAPMYYRYVVRAGKRRAAIAAALKRAGVECARPVYKPLHRYLGEEGFSGAERIYREAHSIPIYPGLTRRDVGRVVRALRRAVLR